MDIKKLYKSTKAIIAIPSFLAFVKVTRKIPLNTIRYKDDSVQIPVVYYENEYTNRKIVFVAVMHIADNDYFSKISNIIDKHNNFTVLYERVKPLSDNDKLTKKEAKLFEKLKETRKIIYKICDLLGLVHQTDALPIKDAWINTDIEMKNFLSLCVENNMEFNFSKKSFDILHENENASKWLLNAALKSIVSLILIFRMLSLFSKNLKINKKIILDMRNDIAINAIKDHVKDNNVLTIWGAEHLHRLDKDIKALGFKEVDREWITAYSDRKIKQQFITISIKRAEQES